MTTTIRLANPKMNRPALARFGKVSTLPGPTHLAAVYVVGGRWGVVVVLAPAKNEQPK